MNTFEYALPETVADIFQYLQEDSVIKAGGIDLIDMMKEGLIAPTRLVNIRSVAELNFIREDRQEGLRIGPNILLADLSSHETIKNYYHALAQAAENVASPQIRNMATLGGNLCQRPRCWYFRNHDFPCARKGGDRCYALDGENQYHSILGNADGCAMVHPSGTAVALMALDARLRIDNGRENRTVPLGEFFVTPRQDITRENILQKNEVITEIQIPSAMRKYRSYYFKQKEKQAMDWPIADAAVSLQFNGKKCREARIVLGSAAPIPWRVTAAEAVVKDTVINRTTARKAAEAALHDAEPLELNAYKVQVFQTIVYRTICWTAGLDPFHS
jgi:xanthine dehydrogenase YagS FAD-binding subunit